QGRGDGTEGTADVLGGIRLGVEGVELAHGAVEEEQDDILGPPVAAVPRRGCRYRSQEVGQSQPEQRGPACLYQVAACQTVAQPLARSQDAKHGCSPSRHTVNGSRI